jgi:hypothetical protein
VDSSGILVGQTGLSLDSGACFWWTLPCFGTKNGVDSHGTQNLRVFLCHLELTGVWWSPMESGGVQWTLTGIKGGG